MNRLTVLFLAGAMSAATLAQVQTAPTPASPSASNAEVIRPLREYLSRPADRRGPIAGQAFATIPLTREQAALTRERLWADHLETLRRERKAEWDAGAITIGDKTLRLKRRTAGEKPADGWPLFISMHGGGGAPPRVNDSQWENQIRLYQFENALVIAPRAPTDNWNLWHESHVDPLFDRLIADAVALEGVNRERVYLMGYSAGGDGVYQLAPRMADRFAAASMMAGHPNEAEPLGLRNLPFAIHMGANDAAYDRNAVAKRWGEKLATLQQHDPAGYEHTVTLHDGLGHWMKLQDQVAIPWMSQHTRNPVPQRVVWRQDDVTHDRFYWLAVPPGSAKAGAVVVAEREGNTIRILRAQDVPTLRVRLDDRVVNLDEPVTIEANGQVLFSGKVARTIATQQQTLAERSDPGLVFDAEVNVTLPGPFDATAATTKPAATQPTSSLDAIAPAPEDVERAVAWLRQHQPARHLEGREMESRPNEAFLRSHAKRLLQARLATPWADDVPEELFAEFVLPYWNLDEPKDAWIETLQPVAMTIVAGAATPGEAIVRLNDQLFKAVGVSYHATRRPRPNQNVSETVGCGFASCTGLSIVLVNACRSVGIPARVVGIADWVSPAGPTFTGNGNHAWVEAWDGRQWRFIGASESSPLDQTWFAEKAKLSIDSNPTQAIYAAAPGKPEDDHYPLVWAPRDRSVKGINVTRLYTSRQVVRIDAPPGTRVRVREAGRTVAAGTPGEFILAGGTTYAVEITRDGQPIETRQLKVP
jgi:transglutaminase-like putative cysteine protease